MISADNRCFACQRRVFVSYCTNDLCSQRWCRECIECWINALGDRLTCPGCRRPLKYAACGTVGPIIDTLRWLYAVAYGVLVSCALGIALLSEVDIDYRTILLFFVVAIPLDRFLPGDGQTTLLVKELAGPRSKHRRVWFLVRIVALYIWSTTFVGFVLHLVAMVVRVHPRVPSAVVVLFLLSIPEMLVDGIWKTKQDAFYRKTVMATRILFERTEQ